MNRYQKEVEEMDRRHQRKMRWTSMVGAAVVAIVALWSAGFSPHALVAYVGRWLGEPASSDAMRAAEKVAPAPKLDGGIAKPIVAERSATESSLSVTPSPLYLMGVFPGANRRTGTALIGTSPDSPQTYGAGAILVNGATLEEIHEDFVILRRGRRTARLGLFSRSETRFAQSSDELLTVGGIQANDIVAKPSRVILTDYFRPTPVFEAERLVGYQVYAGSRAAVFGSLGLQAGDVITSINDAPLSDPTWAMAMFQDIVQGSAVTATILRNGAEMRTSLDGALIVADQERAGSADQLPPAPSSPPG